MQRHGRHFAWFHCACTGSLPPAGGPHAPATHRASGHAAPGSCQTPGGAMWWAAWQRFLPGERGGPGACGDGCHLTASSTESCPVVLGMGGRHGPKRCFCPKQDDCGSGHVFVFAASCSTFAARGMFGLSRLALSRLWGTRLTMSGPPLLLACARLLRLGPQILQPCAVLLRLRARLCCPARHLCGGGERSCTVSA